MHHKVERDGFLVSHSMYASLPYLYVYVSRLTLWIDIRQPTLAPRALRLGVLNQPAGSPLTYLCTSRMGQTSLLHVFATTMYGSPSWRFAILAIRYQSTGCSITSPVQPNIHVNADVRDVLGLRSTTTPLQVTK